MGGGYSFPLDSGKSYSESVEVNQKIYDLTRPGKYTIRWQAGYPDAVLKSNTISLTVIP
jgi:hypothetical protein